jgi:hypothetical protein
MAVTSEILKARGVRHRTFLSYYHRDDQQYRNAFEAKFGDAFITKSVQPGDIASDNSDEYIKRLIQEDYISDASVVVVLVGPKTKCRKHVDWEISAGLNRKVGGHSGLLGILLPTFPLNADNKYNPSDLPPRLGENVASGYARLYLWDQLTSSVQKVAGALDEAFDRRLTDAEKIKNASVAQMRRDICE